MPGISTVQMMNVSVSAAQDLFEITPADDKPVELVGVVVSVRDSETNEQLTCTVQRRSGAYTSGSTGGSAPTAVPKAIGDRAPAYTIEVNNTTRATGGTQEIFWSEGWPTQGGWGFFPIPGCEIMVKQAEALIIGLENAPGSATGMNMVLILREYP